MARKDSNVKKGVSSTLLISAIVAAVLVLSVIGWLITSYNGLVKADVSVDTAWGQVETVYQRRADLIPNLVETVKGYRDFEKETLTAITEARSSWTNAATPEQKVAAANGMESALSRLMVVVENYPDLKANTNFLALQDELANTENKIAVERGRYNEAVKEYNTKARMFPTNMVASMFNFELRTFFEAKPGAENAPEVKF